MVSIGYLLRFIEEDAPKGDITSDVIIPEVNCRAVIRAEQPGIVAGLAEAAALFTHFSVEVRHDKKDGDTVQSREIFSCPLKGVQRRSSLLSGLPSISSAG